MPGSAPKKDLLKEFDKRLKHMKVNAQPKVKPQKWKNTDIVNNVYDVEMQQRFKTLEERLMYRMEVWIDICRVERVVDGVRTSGAGKFHSAKRFRKGDSKLIKVRSFSLGKTQSKSSENIHTPDGKENYGPTNNSDLPGPMRKMKGKRGEQNSGIKHAQSTSDLLERSQLGQIRTPEQEIDDVSAKFGTNPKRKFKFFLFFKKDKETASRKRSKTSNADDSNNNHALGGTSQKLRPSLFDMESLRGSIPELAKLSTTTTIEQMEYDPKKRRGSQAENKFNTVQGVPQETLFQAHSKDSFRSRKNRTSGGINSQLFYEPKVPENNRRKEADIGDV